VAGGGARGAGQIDGAGAAGRPAAISDGGSPGGTATQVPRGSHGSTSPDLTATHFRPPDSDYQPARRRWRPVALAAAVIVVLAGGGVGAYIALKAKPSPTRHHSGGPAAKPLQAPGPSTTAATANVLAAARGTFVHESTGKPFGIQVSGDGKYVFVTTGQNLEVYKTGPGGTLGFLRQVTLTTSSDPGMAATGMTLTRNGKYLLIAMGNGVQVEDVGEIEAGAANPAVGTLTVTHATAGRAVQVVLSPDQRYAFVSLQYANVVGVFKLGNSASTGNGSSVSFVGSVNVGAQPVGLAVTSQWLYVTNFGDQCPTASGGHGHLTVLSLSAVEHDPTSRSAVKSTVDAGCNPARILLSPDGTVWVTTRQSNDVLGFSASRLVNKPTQALIRKIAVGQQPIGIALVKNGTRIVVADNAMNVASSQSTVAVLDASKALAGKPSLLGYIQSGLYPREMAVSKDGRYLYVTDGGGGEIQVIDLSKVP
jgi:DNA-binding beta-propeller fold protein YncE